MKQFYLTCFLSLFMAKVATAQLVEVFPFTGNAHSLLLDGDFIYVGGYNQIKRFNITDDPLVLENFYAGINLPFSMLLNGTDLYVSQGGPVFRILKLDMNDLTQPPIYVIDYAPSPEVLLLFGNHLYYSNWITSEIYRVDITDSTAVVETVFSGITNNRAIAFKDNFLYIAEQINNGRLYRLDITDPTAQPVELASGLARPYDMEFKGNELYIASTSENKIVKTNVTQSLPLVLEDVVTVINPKDILFHGDELYIIDGINSNHLSKLDTSALGIAEAETAEMFLYPNPTNHLLYIKGISTPMAYEIYDLMGRALQKGNLDPGMEVDVSGLASGRYLLRMEGGAVLGFVKK